MDTSIPVSVLRDCSVFCPLRQKQCIPKELCTKVKNLKEFLKCFAKWSCQIQTVFSVSGLPKFSPPDRSILSFFMKYSFLGSRLPAWVLSLVFMLSPVTQSHSVTNFQSTESQWACCLSFLFAMVFSWLSVFFNSFGEMNFFYN